MSTILAVVAHPDDETIGVGGTLARHAARGDTVHILILGDGVMARYAERTEEAKDDIERRRDRASQAADTLGATSTTFEEFPDNEFDNVSLLTLTQRIEGAIERHTPDIIYTHHYGDLNIDHERTCRAVLTATRPLADMPVEEVLAFETLSASEWSTPEASNAFQPTTFVDIEDTLETKLDAMDAYADELRDPPHPRSREAIEQNARLWGHKTGFKAAEAFEELRHRW